MTRSVGGLVGKSVNCCYQAQFRGPASDLDNLRWFSSTWPRLDSALIDVAMLPFRTHRCRPPPLTSRFSQPIDAMLAQVFFPTHCEV